ncbi:transmembrane protein 163a-like [Diadema antillarum]|uniref:transmembrane protein 163a-like n=1 Tax=Diadema antillarum TaxID=105358 RepID=UPI003A871919
MPVLNDSLEDGCVIERGYEYDQELTANSVSEGPEDEGSSGKARVDKDIDQDFYQRSIERRESGDDFPSKTSTDSADKTISLVCFSVREDRLWKTARVLGYVSAALLIILGIFCFVESKRSRSASAFAFALSCFLDASGAVVVIWRSFVSETGEKAILRELQAQLIMGILFWLAALFILVRSLIYLSDYDRGDDEESELLYILLGIGCGLQFLCFILKTPLAVLLHSPALVADGVNSLAACLLAAASIIVNVIGITSPRLAIGDKVVGVVISFFIAGYGSL